MHEGGLTIEKEVPEFVKRFISDIKEEEEKIESEQEENREGIASIDLWRITGEARMGAGESLREVIEREW